MEQLIIEKSWEYLTGKREKSHVIINIILTSIFFNDQSQVWMAASQQHKVDNQPLATLLSSFCVFSFSRWLFNQHWISFKIAVLTFKILNSGEPGYLRNLLLSMPLGTRILRSMDFCFLVEPWVSSEIGYRAFWSAEPKIWALLTRVTSEPVYHFFVLHIGFRAMFLLPKKLFFTRADTIHSLSGSGCFYWACIERRDTLTFITGVLHFISNSNPTANNDKPVSCIQLPSAWVKSNFVCQSDSTTYATCPRTSFYLKHIFFKVTLFSIFTWKFFSMLFRINYWKAGVATRV